MIKCLDPDFSPSTYNNYFRHPLTIDECFSFNLPKAHSCTKWHRPVQQNPQITEYLMKPHLVLFKRLVDLDGDIRRGTGGVTCGGKHDYLSSKLASLYSTNQAQRRTSEAC